REAAADALRRSDQELAQESEAQNHALLGDLHMKQTRYKDAAAAYQKALDAYKKKGDQPRASASQALRSQLIAVDLYNKLAQANLGSGDEDSALKALQQLADYARKGETVARDAWDQQHTKNLAQQTARAAPAIALPTKLIISAPKKLLDQVGAGRISF